MLDCCHSGAFADHAKAAASAPAVTPNTFSSGDAGLYVLTAADTLQFAWDGAELRAGNDAAGGFSQFTSWLVEGLEKGDAAPDDEQITIDALYRYLSRRARAEGSAATPQRFVQGGVGDLVISANPLMGSSQIDPGIMAALHAQEFRTRLGAVAELALLMEEVHTIGARAARRVLQRHLQRERDFQLRRAITKALAEGITSSAEGAPQAEEEKQRAEAARRAEEEKWQAEAERRRAEAARQAEEERQRAEAAGQADEQERPAQVARQVEENVQEPRVVPRNEISGSGVKIITHRRSRNRWAVIAAAALMALTIAGGGYSLYKVQQRIEATQKGAEATQRAEAAQKVAAGQEKRLVGTWKANVAESGVSITLIWHIMPNGTTGYRIHSDFGDKTISGTWTYSDGVIFEQASNGDFSSGSVQWIDENNIVITIKDNSDPGSKGSKRYYSRL